MKPNNPRTINPVVFIVLEQEIMTPLLSFLRKVNLLAKEKKAAPARWILYGSFARGTAQSGSDIDIGAMFESEETLTRFYNFLYELWQRTQPNKEIFGHRIEIIPYLEEYFDPEWFDVIQEINLD